MSHGDKNSTQATTIIPAEEWLGEKKCPHRMLHPEECTLCFPKPELGVGGGVEMNSLFADSSKPCHDTPTHSIPLRVRDKVRVVAMGKGVHVYGITGVKDGEIREWNESYGGRGAWVVYLNGLGYTLTFFPEDLTLIPTEADIVVGSVWEYGGHMLSQAREKRIITSAEKDRWIADKGSGSKSFLLNNAKLIHRGDEVREIEYTKVEPLEFHGRAIDMLLAEQQTNKKEKKMKRAEKEIAIGNPVEDTSCNNQGIAVALYPKTKQVSYEEADGTVRTVHVSQLISRFKMADPKPEPVKKATKKKTKKTTKKKAGK